MAGFLTSGMTCRPLYNKHPAREHPRSRVHEDPVFTDEVARKLHRVIDEYMGVPYKAGGMSAMGMDCSGFVYVVYDKALNKDVGRTTADQFGQGEEVQRRELQYGDLVFFKNRREKDVSHVGIFVGRNEFVHASTSRGVVRDRLDLREYETRYAGAKRVYP
jgi:cell wall-associated NlpC family hydrolase